MRKELSELQKRIIPDAEWELRDFIARFENQTIPSTDSGMERHFKVAKLKPENFRNHKRALAISLGGSNTKVMLADMRDGQMCIDYVNAFENPREQISFDAYMDKILLEDARVRAYLKEEEYPEIGISIPMVIVDDCPLHATKLPYLSGMIARSKDEISPKLSFSANFIRYMHSRPFQQKYRFFYQSDGIVAHHGAVSLSEVGIHDKTILCICGTGMANGDEVHYLPMLNINNLPEDELLYPVKETENRQLQYAVAGKGVYLVMRGALRILERDERSPLRGRYLDSYFESSSDSRRIFELVQYAADKRYTSLYIQPLLDGLNEDETAQLLSVAQMITDRVCHTLSNCIFATMLNMGVPEKDGHYKVFLEGSIARNPVVKEKIFAMLRERLTEQRKDRMGKEMSTLLEEDPELRPLLRTANCPIQRIKSVDTTLIGTISMAMAECC